ncbi:MAG: DNA-binding MarR family transcriptional regulator [Candidatus Poriferisodalaceae bacterium]|jgi:DNA-binding MarR family transcriptional regulator
MAEDRIELLAVVVAQLQTTLNRADRAMADVLAVGSAEDLQVLRLLLAEAPLRVTELARRQSSSVATASARLDRLEKRELVLRERAPGDRRAVVVRLTTRGRRLATKSRASRLSALEPLAEHYPIEDLQHLIAALEGD